MTDRGIDAGRRVACAAAAITAAVLLCSILFQNAGAIAWLPMFALAIFAAVRPFDALLIVAGLGPLATVIQILIGDGRSSVRLIEAITLAFIAGTALRRAIGRERFKVRAVILQPALVLIAMAVASAIVQGAVVRVEQPDVNTWHGLPAVLIRDYLIRNNGVTDAALFAEGLVLLLFAADLCAGIQTRRDRVLRMMMAGATAAAALNIARIAEAALARPQFWPAFVNLFTNVRVNIHFSDWNAAGSYFAMMVMIAAAAARRQPAWASAAAILASAVWLTGSRSAIIALFAVAFVCAVFLMWRSKRRWISVTAIVLVIVAAAAAWKWYPASRNDPAAFSFRSRLELSRAGIRMALEDPMFGVGIGQYYELSSRFADPKLLAYMWRPHENAHDYFVQVLAELGFPGVLLLITVIGALLRDAARAASPAPGLSVGLVVFLLTCVTGHPLLTPEVTYAFWIAMAMALASSSERPAAGPWPQRLTAAAIILLAVTIPLRAREAVRHANLENTTIGLSLWNFHDHERFRWAQAQSTQYLSSAARSISLPLECGPDARSGFEVRIFFDRHEANRVLVPADGHWHYVRFVPGPPGDVDFRRVDIDVFYPDGRPLDPLARPQLMVGQATISWVQ